jgi:hypothetical protein
VGKFAIGTVATGALGPESAGLFFLTSSTTAAERIVSAKRIVPIAAKGAITAATKRAARPAAKGTGTSPTKRTATAAAET